MRGGVQMFLGLGVWGDGGGGKEVKKTKCKGGGGLQRIFL